MMYLYTLSNCPGCKIARELLKDEVYVEVPIDNPLTEVGVQVWFKDGQVHAPILVKPKDGIYFLIKDKFTLIHNLKQIEVDSAKTN